MEQIRGVDSSYSISALLNKKLIEECGRLAVPGRPILYRTTANFLRTFGLESLEDLPEIDTISFDPQKSQLQMEELLLEYRPTLLFVEHDEAFRERVATRRVSLSERGLEKTDKDMK